ncbi:MAG TPA: FAD-dependent oxidoreductase [Allosphingosinicella sp.]|nr:FAD-dependent oxidoreductase [Allosphingosinicella sp.]
MRSAAAWESGPLIGRRQFVASAGLGAAALVLPGCTSPSGQRALLPAAGPSLCLPPVKVSRERVIRELVGLRPYRDGGFVVRAETLADKRLVHNYGHGGAGITLSWGTSRLATELGLQGHQGPVAVLGAGVIGLTTARLVQEAGFPVTIYAHSLPPYTTSNIAGGQWLPSYYYDGGSVTPEWRIQNAAAIDYAYRRFQIMVGQAYGIRWVTHFFEASPRPPDAGLIAANSPTRPGLKWLGPGEHPFPMEWVRQYQVMFIEPHRFLTRLMQDIRGAGGRIAVRSFQSPADVAALSESLVFNCTGLGSRALFGDQDLRPVRGQLVVLPPQPEVNYAYSGRGGYMFPRSDGIILGGSYGEDEWSTVPDPATTDRILASHQGVFDNLACKG